MRNLCIAMKASPFGTITEIAHENGCSRTHIYALRKMQNSPRPVPGQRGKYRRSDWRRFIKKRPARVKPAGEKAELELLCLRRKADLLELELRERGGEVEAAIRAEYESALKSSLEIFRGELWRMPMELSPRFEALSGREIYDLWRERLGAAFEKIRCAFSKKQQWKNTSE